MWGREKPINIFDEAFNPSNPKHINLIESKIKAFQLNFDSLKKTDLIATIAVGMIPHAILSMGISITWVIEAVAACVVVPVAWGMTKGRSELSCAHHEMLNELVEMYCWAAKAGPDVVTNNTFVSLLDTIHLLVKDTSILNQWPDSITCNEQTKGFCELLAKPPHSVTFYLTQPEPTVWQRIGLKNLDQPVQMSEPVKLEQVGFFAKINSLRDNAAFFANNHLYSYKPPVDVEKPSFVSQLSVLATVGDAVFNPKQ